MAQCQHKRGILLSHQCQNVATVACSKCNANVCGEHVNVGVNQLLCLNCFQKFGDLTMALEDWDNGDLGSYAIWYNLQRSQAESFSKDFPSLASVYKFTAFDKAAFRKEFIDYLDDSTPSANLYDS